MNWGALKEAAAVRYGMSWLSSDLFQLISFSSFTLSLFRTPNSHNIKCCEGLALAQPPCCCVSGTGYSTRSGLKMSYRGDIPSFKVTKTVQTEGRAGISTGHAAVLRTWMIPVDDGESNLQKYQADIRFALASGEVEAACTLQATKNTCAATHMWRLLIPVYGMLLHCILCLAIRSGVTPESPARPGSARPVRVCTIGAQVV